MYAALLKVCPFILTQHALSARGRYLKLTRSFPLSYSRLPLPAYRFPLTAYLFPTSPLFGLANGPPESMNHAVNRNTRSAPTSHP